MLRRECRDVATKSSASTSTSDRSRYATVAEVTSGTIAFLALGSVPVTVVAALSQLPVPCVIAIVVNYFAIASTAARLRRALLSPSIAFSAIISITGLAGFYLYDFLAQGGFYDIVVAVDERSIRTQALTWFMLASAAVLFGAAVSRGSTVLSFPRGRARSNLRSSSDARLAIGFALVSALVNLAARNVEDLIQRSSYHIDTPVGGFVTYFQLPAAFLLGQTFARARWSVRMVSILLVVFFVAFSFALSSRLLSVTVLMFFTGVGLGASRQRAFPIAVGGVLALSLIPLPLYLRGLAEQGLGPNFSALNNYSFLSEATVGTILSNLLSSFNIVALTGTVPEIPWSSFFQSFFPLPGILGLASPGSALRINFAVPYAGVGEIANHGIPFLLTTFGILGLLTGWVERATGDYRRKFGVTSASFIPLGVAMLTSFFFVQYNLATAMRFEYVFLVVGLWLFVRSRRGREEVLSFSYRKGLDAA